VPIITDVVNSNPAHGKVYSIKHYVIFVSDFWQVSGLLCLPPTIKLTTTIYNWNIVESGVKHHNHPLFLDFGKTNKMTKLKHVV